MSKAAHQRNRKRQSGVTQPRSNPVGRTAPSRPLRSQRRSTWLLRPAFLVTAGAVLAALILSWLIFSRDDGGNANGGVASIASIESPDFHSLLIDPQSPEHIFFGSHSGIQESRDGGYTWAAGMLKNADAMSMAVSANDPQTLYATGHDVFQVSHDGGLSWQPFAAELPGTDIHAFAQDPQQPSRLFAFVVGGGIWTSADAGVTWSALASQPSGGDSMGMALASNGEALYAATASDLFYTTDLGATWTLLSVQPPGGAISLATPSEFPQSIYVGTPTGMVKSTDAGQTWTVIGTTGTAVLALAVTNSDPQQIVAISQNGDVYRSDDGGATWAKPRS